MSDLLAKPLVPIANEADATATLDALLGQLDADATVVVCHVIEKAIGAPDKASVEQREERAESIFALVRERCADTDVDVQTRIDYGTDVADTVYAAAADVDATAVAFTPRKGSRWIRFLTGDTTLDLVTTNDRPVVVLPDEPDDGDETPDTDDAPGTDDSTVEDPEGAEGGTDE